MLLSKYVPFYHILPSRYTWIKFNNKKSRRRRMYNGLSTFLYVVLLQRNFKRKIIFKAMVLKLIKSVLMEIPYLFFPVLPVVQYSFANSLLNTIFLNAIIIKKILFVTNIFIFPEGIVKKLFKNSSHELIECYNYLLPHLSILLLLC